MPDALTLRLVPLGPGVDLLIPNRLRPVHARRQPIPIIDVDPAGTTITDDAARAQRRRSL